MRFPENSLLLGFLYLMYSSPAYSDTVTVDMTTQRFIGNVSTLDRSKFFTIHAGDADTDLLAFYKDYNTFPGRAFWGPFSYAKSRTNSVGSYLPDKSDSASSPLPVVKGVQTEHPSSVFEYGLDIYTAANWVVEYYENYASDSARPEFFEPMNEPFVHAVDFGFNEQDIKTQMSEIFNEIGKEIHAAPRLRNMKVIGNSDAWPSFELWDFKQWNDNQKLFMDIAGNNMDAFSTHLYDGVNVTGGDNKRSGSNLEAILDLIEAYSFSKWNKVKPFAITEYGAIESGYGSNYSDIANSQSVRSINNMLFGLLEREDRMLISIPFTTDKSIWNITAVNNYQPYSAVLWKPSNIGQPNPTGWIFTPRIHFYEQWKDVKGKRVLVTSDNPDVQVQAFVDANKLYLALNNLDDSRKTVSLKFASKLSGLQSIKIKSVTIFPDVMPKVASTDIAAAPDSIELAVGETSIMQYAFDNNLQFSNVIRSANYYAANIIKPINANSDLNYEFNGVKIGRGFAVLRMSIGRKPMQSKQPVVKINGVSVDVPSNWKGYSQENREDFFGTIEIPVPMNLIVANNKVTINFPDGGGQVASLILHVERFDNVVSSSASSSSSTSSSGMSSSSPGVSTGGASGGGLFGGWIGFLFLASLIFIGRTSLNREI